MKQATVEKMVFLMRYTYVFLRNACVTHTLTYVMHTLRISRIRYANVTRTLTNSTHTVINDTLTDRRR